jgi:hypothetical protein
VLFDTTRQYLVAEIERVLREHKDVKSELIKWAVYGDVFGPKPEASLEGLLAALQRDPRLLWWDQEKLPSPEGLSWADQVEEAEERAIVDRIGRPYVRPAGRPLLPPFKLRLSRPTTHPATAANDGRPPPTAIWGPDKAPMPRERLRRAGNHVFDDEGGWHYDETATEDYEYGRDDDLESWQGERAEWEEEQYDPMAPFDGRPRSPAQASDESDHWVNPYQ